MRAAGEAKGYHSKSSWSVPYLGPPPWAADSRRKSFRTRLRRMRLTQAIFRAWAQSGKALSTDDEEQENQGTAESDLVQASFDIYHWQTTGISCAQATRIGNGDSTSGKTDEAWSHVLLAWDETLPFKLIDPIASNWHTYILIMQISVSTVKEEGRRTVCTNTTTRLQVTPTRGVQSGHTCASCTWTQAK